MTLVLGLTNAAASTPSQPDPSHSYSDFSYFSIGGSTVLDTGKMFDALKPGTGTKRAPVNGPVYTVNQYLQTLAYAFGCDAADWNRSGSTGFGPWLGATSEGVPIRVDADARTKPIAALLKPS
jgi:hypothetical protein